MRCDTTHLPRRSRCRNPRPTMPSRDERSRQGGALMALHRGHGITIPIDATPLHAQRELIEEVEALGYTDAWSMEAEGTDAFTPLAPGLGVGTLAAARHRDRAGLHPRSRPARPERGIDGQRRPRPLRARPGRLVEHHRGAVERARLHRALPAGPGHGALPQGGAHRREGRGELRHLRGQGLPPGGQRGARAARADPGGRSARGDVEPGRPRGRRAPSSTGSRPPTWRPSLPS